MQKTAKLTAHKENRSWYTCDEKGMMFSICKRKLRAMFQVPKDAEVLYLTVSDTKIPGSYLMRASTGRSYVGFFRQDSCKDVLLTHQTRYVLGKSRVVKNNKFYLKVEYET